MLSWDDDSQSLQMEASHGVPEATAGSDTMDFQPGEPLRGHLLSGRTVVIKDPAGQRWLPHDILTGIGASSLIGVPLQARGAMVGVLVAGRSVTGQPFDGSQVQLLEGIARQLAIAMDAAGLYLAQREDAKVSSALAQVGEEMISSLSAPVLLERLCELTTETLSCDCSHTFLWKPEEDAYVPVFGYGDQAEQWETFRLLKVVPTEISRLLTRLRRDDVVAVHAPDGNEGDSAARLFASQGFQSNLCVALRPR